MALLARYNRMQPDQGELRDVMIKADLAAPAILVVAVAAFLALLSLMHVIQLVAAYTIHFQLDLINILFMA